jgi:hypothetical protein
MSMLRRSCCVIAMGLSVSGCATHVRHCPPANINQAFLTDLDSAPGEYVPIDPGVMPKFKPPTATESAKGQAQLNVLAISGGGMYGAFDVGVLHGWSESRTRPQFDVVTGVSTGALIATFAFLGPEYDEFLHDSYTHASAKDIFVMKRNIPAALFSDSLASSEPLRLRIDAAITPEILCEVAAAHAAGRRLYVGTTSLDTRRLVVWDMGAIASRGTPEALTLYRKIILASASVPGFFPPVEIEVEIDGRKYQELHVDGGASASAFVGPSMLKLDANNIRSRAGSNVYVISSGKLYADSECVKPRLLNISAAAASSMLYASTRSDLYRIVCLTMVSGVNFNLLAVPPEFPLNPNSLSLKPQDMQRLYDEGRRLGKDPLAWRNTPPGTEPIEQTLPRAGVRFMTGP